jgi:hypothetical protein
MDQEKSNNQYDEVIANCKKEFTEKYKKYGNSLDDYDISGILGKIYIKLYRIRTIQQTGIYKVEGESIEKDFPAVINYCIYAMSVVKQLSAAERIFYKDEALFQQYDTAVTFCRDLFQKKNHGYGEAWRNLLISAMTQEAVVKYNRAQTIYGDLKFKVEKQKDLEKELFEILADIINYNIFCSIRISEGTNAMI